MILTSARAHFANLRRRDVRRHDDLDRRQEREELERLIEELGTLRRCC